MKKINGADLSFDGTLVHFVTWRDDVIDSFEDLINILIILKQWFG